MTKVKKDSLQVVYNILSQLILNGTNFILIMIFTRFLTTINYGIISIYQSYVLFFAIIVGINVQGSIGPAFSHIDKKEHNNYLASIFILSLVTFITIFIFSIIFIDGLEKFSQLPPILIILMIFQSFGVFCFNFANIKYVYSRKAQYSFMISLTLSILMIIFSLIGVNLNENLFPQYMSRILGLAIPYILCIPYVMIIVFINTKPFRHIKQYWKFCLPICLPLIFHGISQVILSQTGKIILQKATSNYSIVGIYSFILTFVNILNSIYIALNNTWVPIYYDYLKSEKYYLLINRSRKYCDFFTNIVGGFVMLSPEFVKIFSASEYWSGMDLIPIFVLSSYMIFIYSFAINFELYHCKSNWIALGTSISAFFNIALNWILIPRYEEYGAAIATLISYILLFIFHNYCAIKIGKSNYMFTIKFFLKNLIVMVISCVVFFIFKNIWYIRWLYALFFAFAIINQLYRDKKIF